MIAGRWTWRSSSVKKCVVTYLPNDSALKMDGAKTPSRKLATNLEIRVG